MSIGGEDTRGTNRPESQGGTGGPTERRRSTPPGGTTAEAGATGRPAGRSGDTGDRAGDTGDRPGDTAGRPGEDTAGRSGERTRPARNTVGWVALLVAALLTAWQVVVALTIEGVADASQEVYAAVSLFVTLILAVGAVVLGLVGMSQRRPPRWPALVGLAVGAAAFLVTVASWVGGLMNA